MLQNNDIVRFTVNQSLSIVGAQIINVFHYRVFSLVGIVTTQAHYQQIIRDFMGTVVTTFAPLQSIQLDYTNTVFDNMTNLVDQATLVDDVDLHGSFNGPSEPAQVALSFKLLRTNRTTRHGSKRIGGIADGVLDTPNGVNLVNSTPVNAIEAALSQIVDVVISTGIQLSLEPVIVRRAPLGLPITVFNAISGAEYRGAGSQNSRKELL